MPPIPKKGTLVLRSRISKNPVPFINKGDFPI